MYDIPLSTAAVAACGGVYKSDPPPASGRGLVLLRSKIGVPDSLYISSNSQKIN